MSSMTGVLFIRDMCCLLFASACTVNFVFVCSKMPVSLDCPFLFIPSVVFSTDFTKCEQLDRNNCNASNLD